MSIAFVQTATNSITSTSVSAAYGSNVTKGNLMMVAGYVNFAEPTSITDTLTTLSNVTLQHIRLHPPTSAR